ncbi:MAG TPA: DUF262 domain-containing HNH endonuclease family protein [Sulfurimonas sp.]|uniref:DUF262 domain-containing protein n=1 Tax=Sulfurimonas sp. TaxID=2022749 RepID=UPI002C7CC71B|nr:DUF262 domain-containing HNH endonuclease family protein [Sulfurimonas sp.]HUH42102.1 DUF262 domain-containing HNH endonuclease family protein [Sulfurimonas sp.]
MNVEARSLLLENVLKKGQFIIPDYQREYDWNDDNLDEFIDDLNDTEEENYFIGHMVCEGDFNSSKFKVIDGQQRITTITIMLSVLRDIFFEKGLENLSNGLHDNYIFAKDKDYNEYVVLDNQMPYPILQAYVQNKVKDKIKELKPEKSGEKKIIKAYDKFYKLWKDLTEEKLKLLRDKILNLEIIFVAVDDEVDAFTIFETLNAKGKDLTPLDLIKNQVFKNYTKLVHLDEPNDSWKKIIENTKDKNMKFLNYFWASKYKKVSDRKIYKEFIKESKKEGFDYNDFVENLLSNSKIYRQIIAPNFSDWKQEGEFRVYFSLNAIQIFNIQVANSLLISLIREYTDKRISLKYLIKALSAIEKFHFVNNAVIGGRSSGLDTMYSKISREIYVAQNKHSKHTVIDSMINKLKEKLPNKEQFESKIDSRLYFSSSNTKQKKLVQYVLKKIEYEKQNYNVELMNISLEHIYPEKFDKYWSKIEPKYIQSIGNLVLLDKNINSGIGDKSYVDKRSVILNKSTLIATKEVFVKHEQWGVKEIENRKNELVGILYEI